MWFETFTPYDNANRPARPIFRKRTTLRADYLSYCTSSKNASLIWSSLMSMLATSEM